MFSRKLKIALALVLTAGLLSGCGELPRPYKTRSLEEKIDNPILALRDSRAIYVAPVRGARAENSAYLADAISRKLHQWDILATTRPVIPDAYQLVGTGGYKAGQLHYRWALKEIDGGIVKEGLFSIPSSATAWDMGRPDLMQQVADRLAADISAALKPERLEAVAKADAVAEAQVALGAVTGAPGDGNMALMRSLGLLLKEVKLPMTRDHKAAAMIVNGEVAVQPVDGGQDQVTLTWIMQRPDGTELARIQQQNLVPKGSLEGRWGDAAYYAANAVMSSIVEVHSIAAAAYADETQPKG